MISDMGKEPNFSCTAKTPAMVPGTPIARGESVLLSGSILPALSKNIFLVADKGAFSR
jgi:hypothetical protein